MTVEAVHGSAAVPPGGDPLPDATQTGTRRFGFLIVANFPMIPFAAVTETLRIANWLSGRKLYDWCLLTEDGKPVPSASGILFTPHASFENAPPLDDVFVLAGGRTPPDIRNRKLFAWLQRLARSGCRMGAAGLGSFVLAQAGLLDGYRCTVHWKILPNFRSAFPKLRATGELYEMDRNRYTSSGGTGTLDMMLALISAEYGPALAADVAEEFLHDRIRPSHHDQRMSLRFRLNVSHSKVLRAVKIMEDKIEDPISCRAVAASVGISVRQLEKLFQGYLTVTPNDYYRKLRLERAQQLLMQTTMSVLEIGTATGFSSPSHFSKAYKAMFGKQPSQDRGDGQAQIAFPGAVAMSILPHSEGMPAAADQRRRS